MPFQRDILVGSIQFLPRAFLGWDDPFGREEPRWVVRDTVEVQGLYHGLMAIPLPPHDLSGIGIGSVLAYIGLCHLRVSYLDYETSTAFCQVPLQLSSHEMLSLPELTSLRDICLRVEELLGGPADIEWAIDEEGKVWILQARPVTVLPVVTSGPDGYGGEAATSTALRNPVLKGIVASPGRARGVVTRAGARTKADTLNSILVDHFVTPTDLASVLRAKAVVTEEIGILSHTAFPNRELTTPCLAGVERATEAFLPGTPTLVDALGDSGTVGPEDNSDDLAEPVRAQPATPKPTGNASRLENLMSRFGVPIALDKAVTALLWSDRIADLPGPEPLVRCIRRLSSGRRALLWASLAGAGESEPPSGMGAVSQGELLV